MTTLSSTDNRIQFHRPTSQPYEPYFKHQKSLVFNSFLYWIHQLHIIVLNNQY